MLDSPMDFAVGDGVRIAGALAATPPQRDDSDQRLPVVLLHGLSQQRAFWGPVVRRLHSRPVLRLDQRGHGDSDTVLTADFGVPACAEDVVKVLDRLGWERAVVVGHSWGASVALAVGAIAPGRVAAAALIDGGLWSASGLGPREEVRSRLTPPKLALPEAELWDRVRRGDLASTWSEETRAALAPSLVTDGHGLMHSRLGLDRHLRVLDGLLDHDPGADLDACEEFEVPVWAAVCEPIERGAGTDEGEALWRGLKQAAAASAARRSNCVIHRWSGAVHDVPLQWPALVAGFVDALVESEGRAR